MFASVECNYRHVALVTCAMCCYNQWEKKTGKKYYKLDPQGRSEANKDITLMIKNRD